jgi:hypothetical protein
MGNGVCRLHPTGCHVSCRHHGSVAPATCPPPAAAAAAAAAAVDHTSLSPVFHPHKLRQLYDTVGNRGQELQLYCNAVGNLCCQDMFRK